MPFTVPLGGTMTGMELRQLFAPAPVSRLAAQTGDIFFTRGSGLFGALIRRGTSSVWGHVGIIRYVLPDGRWVTHEAVARGFVAMIRDPDGPEIVSVWRFEGLGEVIGDVSSELVAEGLGYDWSSIARLGVDSLLRFFGITQLAVWIGRTTGLSRIGSWRWVRRVQEWAAPKDDPHRVICSDVVTQVLEIVGAISMGRPSHTVTPRDLKVEFEMMAAGY